MMSRNLVDKYGARTFPLSNSVALRVEDGVAMDEDAYEVIKKPSEEGRERWNHLRGRTKRVRMFSKQLVGRR